MKEKKTVEVKWLNGREFRRVTWRNVQMEREIAPGVTVTRVARTVVVTFAVWEHIGRGAMYAHFMGRREF